jgi:3-phenylpropionate/cinnamic acid dioxygenase small subunit
MTRLADRAAIQDALARYARGIDRRDWEILRSAYHPHAMIDQADYKGDLDGLIDFIAPRHALVKQSMHMLTNCLIEFDSDDGALVETQFLAWLQAAEAPDLVRATRALGRYVDRFERRAGDWRIARRTVVFEQLAAETVPAGPALDPAWALARRDADDPLFRERRRLGLA